jgi:CubicO group peptidase (beta-lactamase class C family)
MSTTDQLPRSAPEAQGVASSAILAFVEAAEQQLEHLHSFMLLRHGHVLAEGWWQPYGPEHVHMLFSLSKSFTATAIGLAVSEGRLALDDYVLSFFPDDGPPVVSENLAAMRVRHLLSMSTGHHDDTMAALHTREDGHWVKAFLACPVEHEPGTHFLYNTGATYMLSAIVQQLTGITLLEYLQPRLLGPLGIEQATWQSCPRGINTGGFGLSTTTDAIARFGQLYLQRGVWQGKQLLPEGWVEQASAAHIANGNDPASDWAQGYGFQFWRSRHSSYRGDGAFGQFCIVMPEQDVVLAITSGLGPMQPVLDLAWQHLLPAFGPAPLSGDAAAQTALAHKLGHLAIAPPKGQPAPALAAKVARKTYRFAANEQQLEAISLSFDGAGCTLTLRDNKGEHQLIAGDSAWLKGVTTFMAPERPEPIAAAGAWLSDDTYQLKIYYYLSPFCVTLSARFVGEQLFFDSGVNVSFGPTSFPQLVGTLASH